MERTGQLTLYRGCTPVVDRTYEETSGQSPTMTIVDALAAAMEIEPTELPPLFEIVDPDAIDTLFSNTESETDAAAMLSFNYRTWNVFVNADGRIRVCDATQPTDPQPVFASAAD